MTSRPTLQIPLLIWEAVEIAFRSGSKPFIKTAAKMLQVNENDLIRTVMPPGETIGMILYETDEIRECPAWIPHPMKTDFAVHCRKAIIPGEEFCQIHKHCRHDVQTSIEDVLELEALAVPPEIPPLWVLPGTNTIRDVINIEGKIVGSLNTENNSLTYFTFSQ